MKIAKRFGVVLAIAAAVVCGGVAHAWDSPDQTFHFWVCNFTTGFVNDATMDITSSGGAPLNLGDWSDSPVFWPVPATVTSTFGNTLEYRWGVPPPPVIPGLPPGGCAWFNVYFRLFRPNPLVPFQAVGWFHWTLDGAQVGPEVFVGTCVSSPPTFCNPDQRPDGTPNTRNMTVTNVQFAVSPTFIPNDECTLDNPTVAALFAASQDPLRAGPFTVVPGSSFTITDLHPSITGPVLNGQTVLLKGTVQDPSAHQVPFLIQYASVEQTNIPAISAPGLMALVLAIVLLATILIWRRRVGA